jgi:hypothetical protein
MRIGWHVDLSEIKRNPAGRFSSVGFSIECPLLFGRRISISFRGFVSHLEDNMPQVVRRCSLLLLEGSLGRRSQGDGFIECYLLFGR